MEIRPVAPRVTSASSRFFHFRVSEQVSYIQGARLPTRQGGDIARAAPQVLDVTDHILSPSHLFAHLRSPWPRSQLDEGLLCLRLRQMLRRSRERVCRVAGKCRLRLCLSALELLLLLLRLRRRPPLLLRLNHRLLALWLLLLLLRQMLPGRWLRCPLLVGNLLLLLLRR